MENKKFENNLEFAKNLDIIDPLKDYRLKFHLPIHREGQPVVYLTGNSLGLAPKNAAVYMKEELEKWADKAVLGHHEGKYPWVMYTDDLHGEMAKIVGAKQNEVVVMNSLTVNLHFLLFSFYNPTANRFKILYEAGTFPSDRYAIHSQLQLHKLDPEKTLIEMKYRVGEYSLRAEDIIKAIEENKDTLALVILEGVNYYNGKVASMKKITEAGHKAGALVGFDLAHAAGNVNLELHDWDVDFGCWCTYKYLNSGPGSLAAVYVNEKHHKNTEIPVLSGWWGNKLESRFQMKYKIDNYETAERWQVSNPSIYAAVPIRASLELFNEVGMPALLKKSRLLTNYLEFILEDLNKEATVLKIITPKEPTERGCQISVMLCQVKEGEGKSFVENLTKEGVVADWREPNIMRCAPVPFYNSFEDIFRLGQILRKLLYPQ